ncbi:MAG: 16S rRNA (cytosine(1402)-N(4))-methyltransferase RsmH [Proteobacteria bacterium]|nr:16S rRNA (cytosine(1402)-N(4))-methyltransferase RsmH [Pseudomonadota bacterium]
MPFPHRPVLVEEVLGLLLTAADGIYVDGTVGSGGHSEAIGKRIDEKGRLICLDRDAEAIRISSERLSTLGKTVIVTKARYSEIDDILEGLDVDRVHGILLDLGMSTFQLEHSGRGFSFSRDEHLDMRMDLDEELTAQHLINSLSGAELEKILRRYGEERRARRIAKAIEEEREKGPIRSSLQLANLIQSIAPPSHRSRGRHPATRSFQALRIAVNRELENLERFLEKAPSLILKGGRLVVLSYHSLEDRLVKRAMAGWETDCRCPPDLPVCRCGKEPLFRRLNKKGIKPSKEEIDDNPRARSATLRAAERI